MGRRIQKRVHSLFKIRVSGMDKDGHPFHQDAETVDISRTGARIRWITCLRRGQRVSVQYGREKAEFRVMWVGAEGGPFDGEVGLKCLDTKYIWGVVLPGEAMDDYALPDSGPLGPGSSSPTAGIEIAAPWTGEERRSEPRHSCAGSVELTQANSQVQTRTGLSDISHRGCYLDTLSPMPPGTKVHMLIELLGKRMRADGIVRAAHPNVGMGVEFTEVGEEDRRQLTKILSELSGRPEEEFQVAPAAAPSAPASAPPAVSTLEASAVLDALLQLLEAKGILSPEELRDLLQKAKAGKGSPPGPTGPGIEQLLER